MQQLKHVTSTTEPWISKATIERSNSSSALHEHTKPVPRLALDLKCASMDGRSIHSSRRLWFKAFDASQSAWLGRTQWTGTHVTVQKTTKKALQRRLAILARRERRGRWQWIWWRIVERVIAAGRTPNRATGSQKAIRNNWVRYYKIYHRLYESRRARE